MLQALRGCIRGAGGKASPSLIRDILSTLEGLMSDSHDSTRTTAAACVGAICSCLDPNLLKTLMNNQLLGLCSNQS